MLFSACIVTILCSAFVLIGMAALRKCSWLLESGIGLAIAKSSAGPGSPKGIYTTMPVLANDG